MIKEYRIHTIKTSSFARRILGRFGLALVVIGTEGTEIARTFKTKEEFKAFLGRTGYLVVSIEDA